MRFLLICALVLSASVVVFSDDIVKNDELWGEPRVGDKLIRRDVIISEPSYTGKVTKTYTFPSADTPALIPYSIITAVKVFDRYEDGNGGKATLLAGGPYARDVSIRLKSKLFRGFSFVIEIWGSQ